MATLLGFDERKLALYAHLLLESIRPEDVLRNMPVDDTRGTVPMLLEALKRSARKACEIGTNLAVLVAPTGLGKTTFLSALSMTLAEMGARVTFVVKGKLARTDLTTMFAEIVAKMMREGREPRRILIVFSRYDTCPNREVVDRIFEEGEDEATRIAMFYTLCTALRRRHACPYAANSRKLVAELGSDPGGLAPVLLSKKVSKPIPEKFGNLRALGYADLKDVPFVKDFTDLGRGLEVCPFELLPILREFYDVVVLDHWHLLLVNRVEWIRDLLTGSIVIVDEAHEVPQLHTTRVNLDLLPKIFEKHYSKDYAEKLRERIEEFKRRHAYVRGKATYEEFGVAATRIERPEVLSLVDVDVVEKTLAALRQRMVTSGKGSRYVYELTKLLLLSRFDAVYYGIERVGETHRHYLVAVFRPPLLRYGLLRILASATITPYDVVVLTGVPKAIAAKCIEVARLPFRRDTYVIDIDASYGNRERVAEVARRILASVRSRSCGKLIIASSSWLPLLGNHVDLFMEPADSPEEKERIKRVAVNVFREGGVVMVSPHSSYAVSTDFVEPTERRHTVALVLSEGVPKPTLDVVAKQEFLSESYGIPYAAAVRLLSIKRGVARTLQALGRVQRDPENHTVEVYFVGRHFRDMLAWFLYDEMYGAPKVLSVDSLPRRAGESRA